MRKRWIFFALMLSMFIAFAWDKVEGLSEFFHGILDPALLPVFNWNPLYAMTFLILVISLIMTFVQKYGTDQDELRVIKKRQKEIQKEMKKYSDHPEKVMELNKEQMAFMGKMMKASMGTIVYTAVPFILLFRWLGDYFALNEGLKLLGMHWLLFYFIVTMVFSSILRKVLKVA